MFGCNQADHKVTSGAGDKLLGVDDKEQIINLVKQVYKWQMADTSKNDMVPLKDAKDSNYVGIDLNKHKIRLDELRKANFFSDEFIDNYNKIVLTVDRKLKSKEYEWPVGDLPPFGNDADPWCNCQDYPNDTAWWNAINFRFIDIDNKKSTLAWTWASSEFDKDRHEYTVRVVKINGVWKISYLQGFDFNEYTR